MKNLWKNLDKIAILIKSENPKLLMLDFDGTLTPIVKSPKVATLSSKIKKLLSSLSNKRNFYLAIISGRELADIKNKIGIPNIIYAGNHGLKGVISDRKFSFPITKHTLETIRKIKKDLDVAFNGFSGVFVEDKKIALSFHYRSVQENQLNLSISFLNKILKPYTNKGIISIVKGKKVYEIRPNVNWDKGDFANLLIKKINLFTEGMAIAIFIGDDKSDEDVFRKLKNGITIKVGKGLRSNAKYTLKNTNEVLKFLEWLNTVSTLYNMPTFQNRCQKYLAKLERIEKYITKKDYPNPEFIEFWQGLVRDPYGRWIKYYLKGIKYFKYGKQSKPNLNSKIQLDLIVSSIRHEKAFLDGLLDKNFKNLKEWLILLHKKQAYIGKDGQILIRKRISVGEHSPIVKGSILALAKKYHDPYTNKGTQTLHLSAISPKGLPVDIWDKSKVIHYYPGLKYFDQYLQKMENLLEKFLYKISFAPSEELLEILAFYYQYSINMHIFENVNQSLFTNQINALLGLMELKPIEHGILDFVAMRLQPENFVKYFNDQVKGVNKSFLI